MPFTAEDRDAAVCGRMGGLSRAARYDGLEVTEKARATFRASFLEEVDPTGELRRTNPPEAERRAEAARRLYYARLSRRAVLAKRARRGRRDADAAGLGGPAASQGATEGGDGAPTST